MKAPFVWEIIESNPDTTTYRAKVEGGWLVNHVVEPCSQESLMTMTTTFVPDPQHQWIVDNTPPPVVPDYVQGEAVPAVDKWNTPIV
jgi:hypothetical protein